MKQSECRQDVGVFTPGVLFDILVGRDSYLSLQGACKVKFNA